jgi:hypothetical protein
MSIKQFSVNIHSQNGEDGIISEALNRIKPKLKQAVEFGGADGFYCSNTALLREQGWKVYMYDLKDCPPYVMAKQITEKNINELPKCSVLSIDTDGEDYNLWKAYTGKPDIVIIEINSSLDPDQDHFTLDEGANFSIMNKLAKSKGYFLLCHTGNNIYILNEYKELFKDADETFNTSWLK